MGRIAALVPEFCSEGPVLGQNTDDDIYGAKGDWNFQISLLVINPDGTDPLW